MPDSKEGRGGLPLVGVSIQLAPQLDYCPAHTPGGGRSYLTPTILAELTPTQKTAHLNSPQHPKRSVLEQEPPS